MRGSSYNCSPASYGGAPHFDSLLLRRVLATKSVGVLVGIVRTSNRSNVRNPISLIDALKIIAATAIQRSNVAVETRPIGQRS